MSVKSIPITHTGWITVDDQIIGGYLGRLLPLRWPGFDRHTLPPFPKGRAFDYNGGFYGKHCICFYLFAGPLCIFTNYTVPVWLPFALSFALWCWCSRGLICQILQEVKQLLWMNALLPTKIMYNKRTEIDGKSQRDKRMHILNLTCDLWTSLCCSWTGLFDRSWWEEIWGTFLKL